MGSNSARLAWDPTSRKISGYRIVYNNADGTEINEVSCGTGCAFFRWLALSFLWLCNRSSQNTVAQSNTNYLFSLAVSVGQELELGV